MSDPYWQDNSTAATARRLAAEIDQDRAEVELARARLEFSRVEEQDIPPDYWTRLEHQAAVAALPEVMRVSYVDGLDLEPSQVASDAALYARALVARLKGETE